MRLLWFQTLLCSVVVGEKTLNILFLMADDWRDSINVEEDHPVKKYDMTPNIFELKAESLNFEQAYAQYPQCIPSRSSMLTGWYPTQLQHYSSFNDPTRSGIINTTNLFENSLNVTNIPKHFKANGFQVGICGKILHLHVTKYVDYKDWVTPGYGMDNGPFDYKVCKKKLKCICKETMAPNTVKTPCYDYITMLQAKRMIQELQSPWLIMAGFIRPHGTYTYTKEQKAKLLKSKKKRKANFFRKTSYGISNKKLPKIAQVSFGRESCKGSRAKKCREAYYLSLQQTDSYIGELIAELRVANKYNNTAIVLTSDHGFALGENNHFGKWALYESTTRVPLLIRSPQHLSSHDQSTSSLVELVDLFPTLCDLADISPPKLPARAGKSLVPIMTNASAVVKSYSTTLVTRCRLKKGIGSASCSIRSKGAKDVKVVGHFIATDSYRYIEWREIRDFDTCLEINSSFNCKCIWVQDSPNNDPDCLPDFGLEGIDWTDKGLVASEYYKLTDLSNNIASVKSTNNTGAAAFLKQTISSIGISD